MTCDDHTLVSHIAVIHNASALLVKYSWGHDEQAGWFLPNDGLNHGEHPNEGAKRILKEHLGIENLNPKLAQIESFFGNDKSWHLIFDYVAYLSSMKMTKGGEVTEAAWFEFDKLPPASEFAHNGWGRAVLLKLAKTKL